MEAVGTISEGEWNSFNGMCSEEADFMAQLFGNCSLPHEVPASSNFALSSPFWPAHESNMNFSGIGESVMYLSEEANTSMCSFSQGSSYSGGSSILFPSSNHESFYLTNSNLMTMDYCMMDGKSSSSQVPLLANSVMEGDDFLSQDVSNNSMEFDEKSFQLGREQEKTILGPLKEDKASSPSEISKKRPLIPGESPRGKRSMKLRMCAKVDDNEEDNNNNKNTNVVLHKQSSSSCCSEDDSYVSHEINGVTSSSNSKGNGKTRASRGSATDPQSVYARKRRERINERLRILQNLVPNGTKVDISTMLEEAVQYVKFLQLQIKLLSSDDLWMYAPIAYNGMDIGLDLKISTPRPQS